MIDDHQLRYILDSMGTGVVVADCAGELLYFNPSAVRLTGAGPIDHLRPSSRPGACGVWLPDGTTPFAVDELPLLRAIRGEETDDVRIFVRNSAIPGGRHLGVTGRPWRARDGKAIGGVIVLQDVGWQHEAEQQQRHAHGFLESIVEHVPTMVFVKDATELRFQRFNRAGEELLGIAREVLIGRNDYDFFPREQADAFTRRDRETLAAGQVVDTPEEPIETARGTRWLHTRKVPIYDQEGRPAYLLGISLDITERRLADNAVRLTQSLLEQRVRERTTDLTKANDELREQIAEREKAEAALQQSEEQLRQAQKMEAIGRLAGGVAHDFNNMLTAIVSYGQLAADALPDASPVRADLDQIVRAAERAAGLTRQLLAFSRQQVLRSEHIDLNQVLESMEPMLRRLAESRHEDPRFGCCSCRGTPIVRSCTRAWAARPCNSCRSLLRHRC